MGLAAFGRRSHLGNSLCAPLVLKTLASAYFNSIGRPFKSKNIGHPPTTTTSFKLKPSLYMGLGH